MFPNKPLVFFFFRVVEDDIFLHIPSQSCLHFSVRSLKGSYIPYCTSLRCLDVKVIIFCAKNILGLSKSWWLTRRDDWLDEVIGACWSQWFQSCNILKSIFIFYQIVCFCMFSFAMFLPSSAPKPLLSFLAPISSTSKFRMLGTPTF